MAKVPKELEKQIETMDKIISALNDLVDDNKISMEYYGKDFQEPIVELRKMGLELRDKLQVFKGNMEYAIGEQYNTSSRFASARSVIDRFLSKSYTE